MLFQMPVGQIDQNSSGNTIDVMRYTSASNHYGIRKRSRAFA